MELDLFKKEELISKLSTYDRQDTVHVDLSSKKRLIRLLPPKVLYNSQSLEADLQQWSSTEGLNLEDNPKVELIPRSDITPHSSRVSVVTHTMTFLPPEFIGQSITGQSPATVLYYYKPDPEDAQLALLHQGMYMRDLALQKHAVATITDPIKNGAHHIQVDVNSVLARSMKTNLEGTILNIWKEILDIQDLGVTDNFFEKGGHSLRSMLLIARLQRQFDAQIEFHQIFEFPTVEAQSILIQQLSEIKYQNIDTAPNQDGYKLSSGQRRIWLSSQLHAGEAIYNIPGIYILEGDLDIQALRSSFEFLISRHEILRTVFKVDEDGDIRQFVKSPEEVVFDVKYHDLQGHASMESTLRLFIEDQYHQLFDLSSAPLFRASLFKIDDNKRIFVYTMHHIISDGWSMGILLKELLLSYGFFRYGEEMALPQLRIQYKDYASWQQGQLTTDAMAEHRSYWLNHFEGEIPILRFPED
ncbi:MAG: hypothetical protein EOP48_24095, partial [Sphingobacteriales bacterium]